MGIEALSAEVGRMSQAWGKGNDPWTAGREGLFRIEDFDPFQKCGMIISACETENAEKRGEKSWKMGKAGDGLRPPDF